MKHLLIAIAVLAVGVFGAYGKGVEGLPIKLGDSVEKVRAALGTDLKPEPFKSATHGDATGLRLKTRGIWVFFDREGRAYSIRLDPPFAGNVGGVKIGETRALLVQRLGEPAKVLKKPVADSNPYLYYIDDLTTARFEFDPDDKISTIYLIK